MPPVDALGRIVASFRNKAADQARVVRRAAREGDLHQLGDVAHRICGTGGTLGFSQLSDLARQVEDLVDAGAPDAEITAVAERLACELDRTACDASNGDEQPNR